MIDFSRSPEADALLRQYSRHKPFVFRELAYVEDGEPVFVNQMISLPVGYMRPLDPEPNWRYGPIEERPELVVADPRYFRGPAGIPNV